MNAITLLLRAKRSSVIPVTPERIAELRAIGHGTGGEYLADVRDDWEELLDEIERLQYRCPKCSTLDKFPKFHNYDCECNENNLR